MKTLEELNAIRDKMKSRVSIQRDSDAGTRIVVGMATCGIAAGAAPVLEVLKEEAARITDGSVEVTQVGCIGICQYEPVVEITRPGESKVTYVKMTAEKAKEVFEKHVLGGKPIAEYTIGAYRK